MKALATTMAAAVVAGSLAGGAAMAQDAEITLTPEQQAAVSLVKEFNACVETGYSDPAFLAAAEAVQQYGADAEAFIAGDAAVSAMISEYEQKYFEAMFAQTQEDQNRIVAELEALATEINAAVEAELGPAPVQPADPAEACMAAAEADMAATGQTFESVDGHLNDLANQYGVSAVQNLIAPAP